MNPTRNRFLIFLRDLIRAPYNAAGLWLLRQWLAWPYWRARLLGRPARVAAPPPICGGIAGEASRPGGSGGASAQTNRYIPIFPAARVRQPVGKTVVGARQPWQLQRYANTQCRPAYVAGLADGQFHAPNYDIFSASGCLLPELSFFGPENRLAESREYMRRYPHGLPPAETWPGVTAAVAVHYAETNYFHWMFDMLPRFELLRLAGIRPEQVDRYLVNAANLPFQIETLGALGVPHEKVVAAGPDTHVRAEYLWATSSLRHSSRLNRWVADFLRRVFLPEPTPAASAARLFVSRGDVALRSLANEAEIMARLEPLGFKRVTPGQLPVAEQARLLAGAAVVVAAHGAGLANLVFARPGTKVLELHSPSRRAMHYWELSNACHLDYYYLIGEDASRLDKDQRFRIPLAGLNALLEMAGVR